MSEQEPVEETPVYRSRLSPKKFIVAVLVSAAVPLALVGWLDLYSSLLEFGKPEITFRSFPRGIGVAPVALEITVTDEQSGLGAVEVRIRQGSKVQIIQQRAPEGRKSETISLILSRESIEATQGNVDLEVSAVDLSLWGNHADEVLGLHVDYTKPLLTNLTPIDSIRRGGAQLLLYEAFDDELAVSGVRIGDHEFPGFPIRTLDAAFKEGSDRPLFFVLFAVPLDEEGSSVTAKLFADDVVGNTQSFEFPLRITDQPGKDVPIEVGKSFLADASKLVEQNIGALEEFARRRGRAANYRSTTMEMDRYIERFIFATEDLRELSEYELLSILRTDPSQVRYWDGPFQRLTGRPQVSFGDKVRYSVEGRPLCSEAHSSTCYHLSTGFELVPESEFGGSHSEVYSVGRGLVAFSDNIGTFGRVIGIDHGFGLVSVYSHLSDVVVDTGEFVSRSQVLGHSGRSGLSRNSQTYFELRLQGIPVNPREWWDPSWYQTVIADRINFARREVGLPAVLPMR